MNLLISLACEDARARPDGRLDFIGVFDRLQAPGFPAAQDRMMVVFVMEWDPSDTGRHDFTADLVAPDGRTVLTIEGHTDVRVPPEGGRPRTRLMMPLERVVFPVAGEYRFILSLGDDRIEAFSLVVAESGS
ncbi:MAG: hypothetical protein P8177_04485 [Gemmatimonadota bacterium]|jgi:hypothetical protein